MAVEYTRLNHVTVNIPAGEQEKARAFYAGVMGFQEVPRATGLDEHYNLIWFEVLGIQIHVDLSPPFVKTAESRHFALEVKDIAKVRKEYESKGAGIREAVVIPDRDRFYVLDPWGNYIEILELHANQKKR